MVLLANYGEIDRSALNMTLNFSRKRRCWGLGRSKSVDRVCLNAFAHHRASNDDVRKEYGR